MLNPIAPRQVPRPVARLDALINRLFGARYNPIYQSGTVVVVLWILLLITGLWLLLYYRIAAPWRSVAEITASPWTGRWIRGAHRYASDAAVVATVAHAGRIFLQRRTWGPRTLAWVTGLILFGVVLVSGWTGFVLVWDGFGQRLAVEGARLFDVFPFLSEPLQRAFVGDRPVGNAFFFLNLFLHVALPLGLFVVAWLHVSRIARPVVFPPRRLTWGVVAAMLVIAVVVPAGLAPEADPFTIPASIPFDWFYGFWLPATDVLSPGWVWGLILAVGCGLLFVPRWTRPSPDQRRPPSWVDPRTCTGCTQCTLDCPFEAITMVARTDGRAELVGKVDPARCVSCGICAGSCAPMGVGPPGRTGRDQLVQVEALIDRGEAKGRVVAFACEHSAATLGSLLEQRGATVVPVPCVGGLHTSAIEYVVRAGARAALVLGCPPRDCWSREGPRWLTERLYHEREAELKARVDRRRVKVAEVAAFDPAGVLAVLAELERELAVTEPVVGETSIAIDTECASVPEAAP